MQNQSELTCVSCENTFDPTPHGGFCPDCDTPHPDFGRPEAESDGGTTENAPAEADEAEIQQAVSGDEDDEAELDEVDDDEAEVDDDEAEVDDEVEVDDEADEAGVEDEADEADVDDEADDAEAEDDEPEIEDDEVEVDDDEAEVEDDADDGELDDEGAECGSCGASVEPTASFCPECGSALDEEEDEDVELSACPDCGSSVDDESFCPDCGSDLDAARERLAGGQPTGVTLVIDGDSFSFGDGDSFGRQEEDWLESLVRAAGGREEVKYISSDHLEFSVEDDGVYVTDVSTNGTHLNGEDLEGGEAKLEDGDELELAGRATVQVEL